MENIGIGKFPMVLLFMNLVQKNGAKENCRISSFSVSLKEKNVGILIFTCPPFQIPIREAQD